MELMEIDTKPGGGSAGAELTLVAWDRPIVAATVDRLLAGDLDGGTGDLRDVVLVVPGSRGGRLLLRDLAGAAGAAGDRGRSLVPPRVVTPAALPELAWPAATATPAELLLAAMSEVEAAEVSDLERFVGREVVAAGMSGPILHAAADRLVALEHELAAAGRTPDEAAECLREEGRDDEAAVWQSVAVLAVGRRRRLADAGLRDAAVLPDGDGASAPADVDQFPAAIVLVGVAELSHVGRAALETLAAAGTRILAVARGSDPPEAPGFDEWGCVRPAAWTGTPIVAAEHELVVGETLGDQAALAVEAMADFAGDGASDDVVVGILDSALARPLAVAAAAAGGALHVAGGRRLGERPACRLLEGLARWRSTRRAAVLADLLRLPRFERLLEAPGCGSAGSAGSNGATSAHGAAGEAEEADAAPADERPRDAVALLDGFLRERVPDRLDVLDHVVHPEDRRGRAQLAVVRRAIAEVDRLLAPLEGAARPLAAWSRPLSEVIAAANRDRVRPTGARVPPAADEGDAEAWVRLARLADGLAAIPDGLDRPVDGVEALQLLLRLATAETLPERPESEAVDAMGLLELPFDPAPAIVVAGVHDGAIPGRGRRDPLLPETLRRRLGMPADAERRGRDTYLLAAAVRGRRRVRIVAGRRGAAGDPLIPSRLLLPADPDALPARLARLVAPDRVDRARPLPAPGPVAGFPVPPLRGLPAPPRLRVTAFRDHLECPYRFALAHVLGLEAMDDDPRELDAAGFGSVLHSVLESFGRDAAAKVARGEDDVRAALLEHLDRTARDRFGASPRPAVRLQVDRMRQRLEHFAGLEASWRDEGWRTVAVEHELDGACIAMPDGFEMPVTGTVDRIDRHAETGAWRIIDYKTGDAARSPYQAHHGSKRPPTADAVWKDLQLPLYAHLLSGCRVAEDAPPIGDRIELGFVLLPRGASDVAWSEAAWDEPLLASALDEARRIVAAVRIGDYEPSERPPRFDAFPWIVQRPALLPDGADASRGDGGGDDEGEDEDEHGHEHRHGHGGIA